MASYAKRIVDRDDPTHTFVQIFAGPDQDHRAMVGELCFRTEDEPWWFIEILPGPALPTLVSTVARPGLPEVPGD